MNFPYNATVVVVHGAWADGSSWQAIVGPLEDHGLNVIAAPIPLTSLSDDAAALKRTMRQLRALSSSRDTHTPEPSLQRRTTSA
jgi:hypothetical protein